jgi:hypothetical protein
MSKLSDDLRLRDQALGDYADRALSLEKRLAYADNLINLMGQEIIAYTARHKKRSAIDLLAAHLRIVKGEDEL